VDPAVFVGVNPLRLNPAVIGSDVEDFEAAIGTGALEVAVDLYRGPFLDGFYLGEAPEFEQWAEGERARLEGLYAKTLERLAEVAEAGADHAAAAGWWRRLAGLDPLSSRPVLGLMRGLSNAGDHPAALRHAVEYEALVQEELGTGAGPEVAALAEEIRGRARERGKSLRIPPVVESAPDRGSRDDREAAVDPASTPSARRRGARRSVVYATGAALLAAGLFGVFRLRDEPPAPVAAELVDASIVVLPLANLSADPSDAMLADGMTEELIAMLAKSGDLRVIASTSAFAFRDRPIDVRAIADSLHVANVLEGGVQKIGPRLRVQVRLVDARDGSTRWSETYDREIEDLFVVQQEIAGNVADELGARLGGRGAPPLSRNRARNVAAYELYLRGNDPAHLRSDSGPHRALEYFRQAIAIDSTYAAAWAGLARMYGRVQSTEDPGRPIAELRALSREAALKAVALDDSLGEAHATLGILMLRM
jgi:serine/threonine-protein kinase